MNRIEREKQRSRIKRQIDDIMKNNPEYARRNREQREDDVMLELFRRSGVPFEVTNSHTTVDAPPTVYHIRKKFQELENSGIKCKIEMPEYRGERVTMWSLIVKKMYPPTRQGRYCCEILKEQNGKGRYIATGVRWDESAKRKRREEFEKNGKTIRESEKFTKWMLMNDNSKKRRMNELCMQKNKMIVNPVIDWKNSDVWEYIHSEKIEVCDLYKMGYDRVGCVGCPMAGKKGTKSFKTFRHTRMHISELLTRLLSYKSKKELTDGGKMEWMFLNGGWKTRILMGKLQ